MSFVLIAEQILNGLQFGIMLFLMSAGLTLIFGVMGLINLAHGSLYMIGAFVAATVASATGSIILALAAALSAGAIAGAEAEAVAAPQPQRAPCAHLRTRCAAVAPRTAY